MGLKEDKHFLLVTVFVSVLVVSNVLNAKLLQIGCLAVPGGVICYAITYLMSDVIGELYGKECAGRTVVYGLICQIFCTILISISLLIPSLDVAMDEAYKKALGANAWFTIAGLLAYVVSQEIDIALFHSIRRKMLQKGAKHKWVWNNVSTIVSQAVDTVIFIGVAFGMGQGYFWEAELRAALLQMCFSQYFIKVVLAIVDTPFFYLLTREKKNKD